MGTGRARRRAQVASHLLPRGPGLSFLQGCAQSHSVHTPPTPTGKHSLATRHAAEASMNSFTCLPSSVCILQELGEEPGKQLPGGQLHCSHFNQKGCWGTGMLGSVCKAAQESWSRLVTRQPGGRKVSGRVCLTALESGFTKRPHFLESRSWWRDWGFTSGFTLPRANP